MKKLTLSDFSGGQNEVNYAPEFEANQWARLQGFILNKEGLPQSQPPIQRIGSFPTGDHFYKLHSIVTSVGTFLLAITRLGRLYWCKAPNTNDTFTTANAISWTRITQAENYNWTAAGTPSKETLTDNPYLRFICNVPVFASDYVRNFATSNPQDVGLDTDAEDVGEFPGVLISYRTKDKTTIANPQVLVAYVDTLATTPTVRVIVFPHQRRIPTFETVLLDGTRTNDFINAVFLSKTDNAGTPGRTEDIDYDTMKSWPFDMSTIGASEVKMHPYNWNDVDGASRGGKGIIPRATIGCSIQGKVILGDIEWRNINKALPAVPSSLIAVGQVSDLPVVLPWPTELQRKGRVLFNNGPGKLYLRQATSPSDVPLKNTSTGKGLVSDEVAVIRAAKSASPAPNTCVLELVDTPPTTGVQEIVVSGVGPNYNGKYTSANFSINGPGKTVSFTSTKGPATIASKAKKGKVVFKKLDTSPVPVMEGADLEIEVGGYASIPNSWDYIAAQTTEDTTAAVFGFRDRLLARHFYNDDNTGRMPNMVTYSLGAIDEYSPVTTFSVGRAGAPLAALDVLDGRVIALTEGGGPSDGLYRIRGNLSLAASGDPTAVSVELIKGGVGAPVMPENIKNAPRRSCLWSDTSTFIFADRKGGIYFTDGSVCDRIDRRGPVNISNINYASLAAVGRHLFVTRGNEQGYLDKLYCFSLTDSDGTTGTGVWTQLSLSTQYQVAVGTFSPFVSNVPAGAIVYEQYATESNVVRTLYSNPPLAALQLTSGREDLYFIGARDADGQANEPDTYKLNGNGAGGGHVYRLALAGPHAEYGMIDNVPVAQWIHTPTIVSAQTHEDVKINHIGIQFVTPQENYVGSGRLVHVNFRFLPSPSLNAPALPVPPASDFLLYGTTPPTFSGNAEHKEKFFFGYGPHPTASFGFYFDGHVRIHNISLWSTAELPESN